MGVPWQFVSICMSVKGSTRFPTFFLGLLFPSLKEGYAFGHYEGFIWALLPALTAELRTNGSGNLLLQMLKCTEELGVCLE